MTSDVSKAMKDLHSVRCQEESLFHHLASAYSSFQSLRSDLSSSEDSSSSFAVIESFRSLRSLYRSAFQSSCNELKYSNDCIEKLRRLIVRLQGKKDREKKRSVEDHDNNEPLAKKSKSSSSLTEGGDIWTHEGIRVLENGMTVAALTDEHSKPPLWILATLTNYKAQPRARYEVYDNDAGEDSYKKKYLLEPRKIIPMPSLSQVPMKYRKEFSKNENVLAVFPVGGTTVLYPATVVQGPKKRKTDDYMLKFDDDEEDAANGRVVAADMVVPLPRDYGKTSD